MFAKSLITRTILATVFIGCLFFFAGCRSIPYDMGVPLGDGSPLKDLVTQQHRYPARFSTVHRTILTRRNRQFDFVGYLDVTRAQKARLVAVTGVGVTLFDVAIDADGETQSRRKAPEGYEDLIEQGILRDLEVLYLRQPKPGAQRIRHGSGTIGLLSPLPDGGAEEFIFESDTGLLTGYARLRRNRCNYRVHYAKFRRFPLWPHPVPSEIRVDNYAMGYELDVRVVALEPAS